eukprot:gnl/Hemi2/21113_TR7002_c0_g1_i1.p1 gnl/Hemi2/21113_TR7002_c0_g1~~gnl/Hemi2/21113_TR7002_c0_g1_i1.p1  ORF type:complete len:524 (+),score=198.26 gnl/Hemi2/21113_TR7002_c0_g1_i1:161-1732(+)
MRVRKVLKGESRETEEMRRVRIEKQMLKLEAVRKAKEEQVRNREKALLLQEEKVGRINRQKVQQNWRKLLQPDKLEQLKRHIEILQKTTERTLDRKDTNIKVLDRDLAVSEKKHLQAYNDHLKRSDALDHIQETRRKALEEEYQRCLDTIKTEFENERVSVMSNHIRDKRYLAHLMMEMQQEWTDSLTDELKEYQKAKEELKNKGDEDKNFTKHTLDGVREALNAENNELRTKGRADTIDLCEEFKERRTKTMQDEKIIRNNTTFINKRKTELKEWKAKIASTTAECTERNSTLREEKDKMRVHFQELKAKMLRQREQQRLRLAELIANSRAAIVSLDKKLSLGERLFKLAELNRKFESEREKLLPFYPTTVQPEDDVPAETDETEKDPREKEMPYQPTMLRPDGRPLGEHDHLENFYKRFNKVKLDTVALQGEKARLTGENQKLRSLLKQYLDGISVNQDVLASPNALLITTPTTLYRHQAAITGPGAVATEVYVKPVVEAAHVYQTAILAGRVPTTQIRTH